jgi:hypothetical protein
MTETAKKWKQVPWLRIGAEAVAIVASILIAFSLDAWWDRHQSAEQEGRYLESLEKDFLENRENLEQTIQVQSAVLESLQQLVLMGSSTALPPDADSVVGLVTQVFRDINVGFSPNLGTYGELLNTSSLQILRNDSLRVFLSDFGVRMETVGRMEAGAADGWSRETSEHLMTRLDLAAALPQHLLGTDSVIEAPRSMVDYRRLPADRVFRNVMVGRLAVTAMRLSMYRALAESVEEVLRILGSELGH